MTQPTPLPDLPREGVPLGACRLFSHLGRGAMGQVWQGVHASTGVPVAVKVMTDAPVHSDAFVRAFRNEVEAVARLHHPGIVHIYDCGEVAGADAQASDGLINEGSPFLVMELVQGGKLDRNDVPFAWSGLKAVLLQLLDALAHAHAHGVIHRDLKPGNVLTRRVTGYDAPMIKLTDFGLAHALDDHAEHSPADDVLATSGTPPYMAPEQFQGDWRAQGPWTDLYALGCMAFALAAGDPPFRADDVRVMAYHHMLVQPPALRPRIEVPRGFAAWVHTLLAKKPEHRFARAADASHALEAIDDRVLEPAAPPHSNREVAEASTDPAPDTVLIGAPPPSVNVPPSRPPVSITLLDRRPPPLARDWRRADVVQASMLVRAGINLFGLREAPLVAREAERDAIWAALRAVHGHHDARAVVIRGASGTGKSRLARWIASRADELGAAIVLRASHSAHGGTHDGILPMLLRHLRAGDLDRAALSVRLDDVFAQMGDPDQYLKEALLDLFTPSAGGATELIDGARAKTEEREWLVLRVLCLLSLERPLVLLIDDAQWGLDALRLVRRLLSESGLSIPALALITVRDDALGDRPLEQAELEALLEQPKASAIDLGVLSHGDQRVLVAQLLGLTNELVDRVASRTGGNPLFAVQLVGDWVARGLLVPSSDGLVLAAAEEETLPADIEALCRARLAQALASRPADDSLSLELAALLGAEFDEAEWTDACREASLSPSRALLPDLARHGLLQIGFSAWRFAHGVIRETIELTARAQQRFASRHRVIAQVLRARYPGRSNAEACIRIGRHLREGEALHEAHTPLLTAARALRIEADHARAIELLRERSEVLDRLAIPAADPLRAEGDLTLAQLYLDRGDLERGRDLAARVAKDAEAHGWPALAARALLRLGDGASADDDWAVAHSLHAQALATLVAYGDRRGEFEARQGVAEALYYQGDLESCADAYRENRALAETLGDELALAETLWGLGYVTMWQGDLAGAHAHFEGMREILTRRGATYRLCEAYNSLGESARFAGNYHEAEQWYWAAVRLGEAFGTSRRLVSRVNIGISLLARGERDAAEALAEQVITEARALRQRRALCGGLALSMMVRAQRGTWNRCSAALVEVEQIVTETRFHDGDVASLCLGTGELAAEAGEHEVGARAVGLARAIWRVLGRRAAGEGEHKKTEGR